MVDAAACSCGGYTLHCTVLCVCVQLLSLSLPPYLQGAEPVGEGLQSVSDSAGCRGVRVLAKVCEVMLLTTPPSSPQFHYWCHGCSIPSLW